MIITISVSLQYFSPYLHLSVGISLISYVRALQSNTFIGPIMNNDMII